MTPKEKCTELFNRFYTVTGIKEVAKPCALIAVDEILDVFNGSEDYWQQVKSEIEKL